MNFFNKHIFFVLLLIANKITFSQVITGDSTYIKKALSLFNDSLWNGSIVAFTAKDISNNKILLDVNGNYKLTPASIVKLITSSAGLSILGSNYRFTTELGYTGNIIDSILYGNIVLKGYGDPTLYSSYFKSYFSKNDPFDSLVTKLLKLGVKVIKGKVIGDATFFQYNLPPSTWVVGDISNYYGASPCALSIYNNEYSLFFSTKDTSKLTKLLNVYPSSVKIELNNKLGTSKNISNDQSIIYGDLFDSTTIIIGMIPFNKDSFEVRGSIRNPAQTAAIELKNKLSKANITINDTTLSYYEYNYNQDTSVKFSIIHKHYSPTLNEIVYITNQYSVNLFAEHISRICGWRYYKKTTPEMGNRAISQFWKKYTDEMLIYDGSGLSRFNAVSTQQFIRILEFMYNQSSYKKHFYKSLPVAGETGTLTKMFDKTKAKGKIVAKTGTMSQIRSFIFFNKTICCLMFLCINYCYILSIFYFFHRTFNIVCIKNNYCFLHHNKQQSITIKFNKTKNRTNYSATFFPVITYKEKKS